MQYKQFLLSVTISLSCLNRIYAQDHHFYIKAGAEYAVPIMGTKGFKGGIDAKQNPSTPVKIVKNASFGGGFWTSLNVGYFLSPNFGIDVGADIGIANTKNKLENIYPVTYGITTFQAKNPILISPSLTYRLAISNLSILGRTGIVVPINTTITQSYTTNYPPDYATTAEITNRFALGFSCGIGAEYKIVKQLAISLEAKVTALTVDSRKIVLTSAIVNGVETINKYPIEKRTQYYEYEIPLPSVTLLEPMPISFSHAGAKLGLVYYF
jgi:hypothetical protein